MDKIDVNGIRLAYEEAGEGPPVVLVHGSWSDRHAWDLVAPALAERYRVITYDRRGHSQSERPPGAQGIATHVDDLAGLLGRLGAAPAYLVTSSLGGEIALKLAAHRPDLVAGLCLHEPSMFELVADDPRLSEAIQGFWIRCDVVAAEIVAGRVEEAARSFVETIALGPGGWDLLPEQVRRTMIHNAPTWLDDYRDPSGGRMDRDELTGITAPIMLTRGTASPPDFLAVDDALAAALPTAYLRAIDGAGHVPHRTHPEELVTVVLGFLDDVTSQRPVAAGH